MNYKLLALALVGATAAFPATLTPPLTPTSGPIIKGYFTATPPIVVVAAPTTGRAFSIGTNGKLWVDVCAFDLTQCISPGNIPTTTAITGLDGTWLPGSLCLKTGCCDRDWWRPVCQALDRGYTVNFTLCVDYCDTDANSAKGTTTTTIQMATISKFDKVKDEDCDKRRGRRFDCDDDGCQAFTFCAAAVGFTQTPGTPPAFTGNGNLSAQFTVTNPPPTLPLNLPQTWDFDLFGLTQIGQGSLTLPPPPTPPAVLPQIVGNTFLKRAWLGDTGLNKLLRDEANDPADFPNPGNLPLTLFIYDTQYPASAGGSVLFGSGGWAGVMESGVTISAVNRECATQTAYLLSGY